MLVLRAYATAFFLLFMGACGVLHAQADSCALVFSGIVLDEHDKSPLSFAEVYLPGVGKGAVADVQGRFRIEGLCAGNHPVRVMHLGCDPVERTVSVKQDLFMEFKLEHHAEELREFEVARDRPDEHVGSSTGELDKAAMEKSSGRTLSEMLVSIPGVTMLSSGPTIGKPMIHGLTGNRILILNQGIRQEDQQWGTEHAPNLDPFSSDRITVVKGAASVQYGSDAMGGVVITEPVELPRQAGLSGEVRGVGKANGQGGGGNAMLQGGIGKLRGFGWRVQGSGRYLGDARAAEYVLSNTGLREQGASASMGFRDHRWSASVYYSWFARELGILRAAHIGNLTDLNNAIARGRPWFVGEHTHAIGAPRQTVQHHLAKAEVGYAISDRNKLELTYGYQGDDRQEFDVRRGGRDAIPATDLFLVTHTADVVLKHWIGPHVHGKIGASGLYQENINRPGTGVRPLIPNYAKEAAGVFVLEHFPISERLELEAGARVESTRLGVARYNTQDVLVLPVHHFRNSAFSAGANWTLRDSLRLRFNISTAYRPPHVSELYSEGLHHGSAAIETGDDRLDSERSMKATADLQGAWFNGKLTSDVTIYADRIADHIYLRPAGVRLTIRGAFPEFAYVATDALLYGLDLGLQYRLGPRWRLRNRSSIVRGRDRTLDEWLFQMPSDRTENAVVFTLNEARQWRDIEAAVSSSIVLEQRRIPIGLDFTTPPPGYHLVGVQISATRAMGTRSLRVGLQVNNLFNVAYRDYLDRFRYFADARGTDVALWLSYRFGGR